MDELKLNLGCGFRKLPGYVNVDYINTEFTDKVVNLNKFPWPFKENSVSFILMDNTLEHLEDVGAIMKEIYKVLIPGGRAKIIVPYYNCANAHSPAHTHFFSRDSFLRYTTSYLKGSGTDIDALFKLKNLNLIPTRLGKIFPKIFRIRFLASLVFGEVIKEILFEVEK